MMEDYELEKNDPKRFDLEQDRIILEFVKNSLQNYYDLYPTRIEADEERIKAYSDPTWKHWLNFKVQQKKILIQMIEFYNDELNKLNKEDAL